MPTYSPARWLAPLSLLAATAAVLAILASSGDGGGGSTTTTREARGDEPGRTATQTSSTGAARRATYTVKSGDVLSAIAADTGVSVERLQELNPGVDAQTLRVGQKLKLRP